MQKNFYKMNGFIALEAMLAVSILVIFFVAFMGVVIFNRQNQESLSNRSVAVMLCEEGIEGTRNIRDADFNRLADGKYGLIKNNGKWQLIPGNSSIDNFVRQIEISSLSTDEKKIVSNIIWYEYGNKKDLSLTSYLSNWK